MAQRKLSSIEINYFKIGSFVLVGLTLIIIAIIIFGSGKLFQKTVYIETYFDETVQGLSVGSPVKYRGFQIGYVKKISLANAIYGDSPNFNTKAHNRYIYVEIAITEDFLTKLSKEEFEKMLKHNIEEGLRIKLSTQGLTGISYLELNFLDPKESPPLPVEWTPNHFYIPSCPSLISQFTDNVQYVFNELKKVNFTKLFENIEKLAQSSQSVAQQTHDLLAKTNHKIIVTINNLEHISENLRVLSEQAKSFPSQVLFGQPPPQLDPSKL
jgi:ABC-type transporter Mla subunit MlaD